MGQGAVAVGGVVDLHERVDEGVEFGERSRLAGSPGESFLNGVDGEVLA